MKEYELILENTRSKRYLLFTRVYIAINLLLFVAMAINGVERQGLYLALGFGLVTAAAVFLYRVKRNVSLAPVELMPLAYLLVASLVLGLWLPAILTVVVALLLLSAQRSLTVKLNNNAVRFPTLPPRTIKWSELNNVVFKDGFITLDFRNNRIAQSKVVETANTPGEQEFNEFCRTQLVNARAANQSTPSDHDTTIAS